MRNAYEGSVHVPGSLRPTFVWEPSTADEATTITYELELSTDATFIVDVTTEMITRSNYRPAADLPVPTRAPVGARFYWRVRACTASELCSAVSPASWVNVGRSDRDFNGDGFADVVVGAPLNDVGGMDAGRAYVYFGGAGGVFDATPDGTLTGAAAYDYFGFSVASAGDVNGDGFADVLVGAHGNDAAGNGAGRAYVYFGGAGGSFEATPDGKPIAAAAADFFGASVASAGDVNGDGFADVLVGAPFNDAGGNDAGRAYVYFGGAGGTFDATPDGTLTGAATGESLGTFVASAGDVNGDGFADVIVGAERNDAGGPDAGSAYVYFGGAGSGFNATPDGTLTGAVAGGLFGGSLASAGDVNGDGFADVIVGAWGNDAGGPDADSAYVYFGGAGSGFDATPDGTLTGAEANDDFGYSVASAGDVNGDGFADVVVGAIGNDTGGMDAGRAYVYLGGAGGSFEANPDGMLTGAAAGDYFGRSVASAGDVNGDDFADVVIGAIGNDTGGKDAGRAYVYFGGAGSIFETTPDSKLTYAAEGDWFGCSVASVGDIHNNGFADALVGAHGNDTNEIDAGRACVYSGGAGWVGDDVSTHRTARAAVTTATSSQRRRGASLREEPVPIASVRVAGTALAGGPPLPREGHPRWRARSGRG